MQMWEAIWLYHLNPKSRLTLNLFYGINENPIIRLTNPKTGCRVYENGKKKKFRGVEVSWQKDFNQNRLFLSYSLNNNQDPYRTYEEASTPKRLFKGWFDWKIASNINLFSALFHRSSIKVNAPTYSVKIPAHWIVNETINYKSGDFEWQFGVKNLLNKKVAYLTQPSDILQGRYMFVPSKGAIYDRGRAFFFSFTKRW